MVSMESKGGTGGSRQERTIGPFKGVRMRKWGCWVSEIRIPPSKRQIWFSSYDAPEKAACAYDAVLYCLHGLKGKFNFLDDKRPEIPDGSSTVQSKTEIKEVAARFALPNCMLNPSSFTTSTHSPELQVMADEMGIVGSVDDLLFASGVSEPDVFMLESFLFDEQIMFEPDSIWAIY